MGSGIMIDLETIGLRPTAVEGIMVLEHSTLVSAMDFFVCSDLMAGIYDYVICYIS